MSSSHASSNWRDTQQGWMTGAAPPQSAEAGPGSLVQWHTSRCSQRTVMRAGHWSGLAVRPRPQPPPTLCGTARSERTTPAYTAVSQQLPHLDDWQWQVMAPCVQQQAPVPEARRIRDGCCVDCEKRLDLPFLVMLLVVLFVVFLVVLLVVMLGDRLIPARACTAQAEKGRGLQTDQCLKSCRILASMCRAHAWQE